MRQSQRPSGSRASMATSNPVAALPRWWFRARSRSRRRRRRPPPARARARRAAGAPIALRKAHAARGNGAAGRDVPASAARPAPAGQPRALWRQPPHAHLEEVVRGEDAHAVALGVQGGTAPLEHAIYLEAAYAHPRRRSHPALEGSARGARSSRQRSAREPAGRATRPRALTCRRRCARRPHTGARRTRARSSAPPATRARAHRRRGRPCTRPEPCGHGRHVRGTRRASTRTPARRRPVRVARGERKSPPSASRPTSGSSVRTGTPQRGACLLELEAARGRGTPADGRLPRRQRHARRAAQPLQAAAAAHTSRALRPYAHAPCSTSAAARAASFPRAVRHLLPPPRPPLPSPFALSPPPPLRGGGG